MHDEEIKSLAKVRIERADELIRTASDYDDFYIASKEDCERQVEEAKLLIKKVKEYLLSQGVMVSPGGSSFTR